MNKFLTQSLLAFLGIVASFAATANAECPIGEKPLDVTILADTHPDVATWRVRKACTGEVVVYRGTYESQGIMAGICPWTDLRT